MKIIDISNDLLTAEVYAGDPVPELHTLKSLENGDRYNLNALYAGLHNGTHMDAPLHFLDGGADAAQIPLDACIGPCRVLEVTPGIITGEVVENSFPRGCERLLLKSSGKAFIHETAAQAMTYYGCKLVGTDALSIDPDYDETGAAHCAFLRENVVILEGLNLASVHNGEYFLIAPPVKIGEAEAAFTRAVLVSDYIFWSGKSPLA